MSSQRAQAAAIKASAGRQVDYVLVALLEAGGADRFVDIEDLAVAAYRLAPHLFRWRKYPEFPSAELTRMALRHATQGDDVLFVKGAGGRARRFTVKGLEKARDAQERLLGAGPDVTSRVPMRPATRDIARMERHPALVKWNKSTIAGVSRYDLADLLLCAPSSPTTVFLDRLNGASAVASQWGREELLRFFSDAIANLDEILVRRDDDRHD